MNKDQTQLAEFGGPIQLNKEWAKSLLRRMGFTKRKATKGIKNLPDDFNDVKSKFIKRIENVVKEDKIPDELIINWDQTGVNLIPCGSWTMEESGSKQVSVQGSDDKRQITALLAIAKSGTVLSPQIIYQGKTDLRHPVYKFPSKWHITHTPSHWSTSESMSMYVNNVIVPYVDHVREALDLPLRQKALCIFDVYKAHRGEELLKLLGRNGIRVVYVPAACTDQLQPLDLVPNNVFKGYLKAEFQRYYADQVQVQLQKGHDVTEVRVDVRLSTIKPLHAKWLVSAIKKLSEDEQMIKKSFQLAGI